jgi:hypothetical protein
LCIVVCREITDNDSRFKPAVERLDRLTKKGRFAGTGRGKDIQHGQAARLEETSIPFGKAIIFGEDRLAHLNCAPGFGVIRIMMMLVRMGMGVLVRMGMAMRLTVKLAWAVHMLVLVFMSKCMVKLVIVAMLMVVGVNMMMIMFMVLVMSVFVLVSAEPDGGFTG